MEYQDLLTPEQGQTLVQLARQAIEVMISQDKASPLITDRQEIDPRLLEKGATFVTLTIGNTLRGCIGSPEAHMVLADDVQENAVRAATMDPRFPPVSVKDLPHIHIEVSVLTPPRLLDCPPEERPRRVCPGQDGLLLTQSINRGLLLPQVWEKLSDPEEFLQILCYKANLPGNAWKKASSRLYTFQVQAFHETTPDDV